ncbi:MAG TPA: protein-L-isoaspartate(D-aspartate) O-methyltransferase [Terriglobales bacterium]|jgi:protein-L-isoaspartate(D-aspartate) O-methyltransferase|nr:protein-L-isoaspartate(D-aspartate) O-methyltransferase [Terriglobales bacterium]
MSLQLQRVLMVERQLKARGIFDERVLSAIGKVQREDFISPELREHAYEDRPLTIGCCQTISQPYIVASMLQAAELRPEDRVLELGTGSGYQTALLAEIVASVFSIERHVELADIARERLSRLGYTNVEIVVGDGTLGYPPKAPYDVILVSAAAPQIPQSLVAQLAVGGRMVLPVGSRDLQELVLIRKDKTGVRQVRLDGCAFVPLIGEEGFRE